MLSVVIRIIVLHSSEKARKDALYFIVCMSETRPEGKGHMLRPGQGAGMPGSIPSSVSD